MACPKTKPIPPTRLYFYNYLNIELTSLLVVRFHNLLIKVTGLLCTSISCIVFVQAKQASFGSARTVRTNVSDAVYVTSVEIRGSQILWFYEHIRSIHNTH